MTTSPYEQHRQLYHACTLCSLCEGRSKVVLARGTLPGDVAFVGEAPGISEDTLGRPFVGPAGKLLDRIIARAWSSMDDGDAKFAATYALTNIVACFPKEQKATADHRPPEEAMQACFVRLQDFMRICRPKLVVCVGGEAAGWIHKDMRNRSKLGLNDVHMVDISHPAAILRAQATQQGLLIKRCIATISTVLSQVFGST